MKNRSLRLVCAIALLCAPLALPQAIAAKVKTENQAGIRTLGQPISFKLRFNSKKPEQLFALAYIGSKLAGDGFQTGAYWNRVEEGLGKGSKDLDKAVREIERWLKGEQNRQLAEQIASIIDSGSSFREQAADAMAGFGVLVGRPDGGQIMREGVDLGNLGGGPAGKRPGGGMGGLFGSGGNSDFRGSGREHAMNGECTVGYYGYSNMHSSGGGRTGSRYTESWVSTGDHSSHTISETSFGSDGSVTTTTSVTQTDSKGNTKTSETTTHKTQNSDGSSTTQKTQKVTDENGKTKETKSTETTPADNTDNGDDEGYGREDEGSVKVSPQGMAFLMGLAGKNGGIGRSGQGQTGGTGDHQNDNQVGHESGTANQDAIQQEDQVGNFGEDGRLKKKGGPVKKKIQGNVDPVRQ